MEKKHIGLVLFNLSLDHPSWSISYVKGLATYLTQQGFDVTIFCNEYLQNEITPYKVHIIKTKRLYSWMNTVANPNLFQDFVKLYTKEISLMCPSIDLLIFQHQVGSNAIATNIKQHSNIPLLSVIHGTDWHELYWKEKEKYIILELNNYDALICPSETMKQLAEPYYKNNAWLIVALPGVNSTFLQKNIWKDTWNYVLFVGRLIKEKWIIEWIDAFLHSNLYQKDNMKLYIIGNGELESEIQEKYKDQINSQSLVCFGKLSQSQISKLMQKAYCLIFPSIWNEPFWLVLIEAMAVWLPILATNVGIVQKILGEKYPFIVEKTLNFTDLLNNYREFSKKGKEILSKKMQKRSKLFQREETSKDLLWLINKCI